MVKQNGLLLTSQFSIGVRRGVGALLHVVIQVPRLLPSVTLLYVLWDQDGRIIWGGGTSLEVAYIPSAHTPVARIH